MSSGSASKANKRLLPKLVVLTLAMFGFGFAMVPLYDVFCQITGLNGKTGRVNADVAESSSIDTTRWVTVEFTGSVMGGLPWEFGPLQASMRVHPGQSAVVNYYARNNSQDAITGRAVPSVSPGRAAKHFNKIECFCFSEQELNGGEYREMPVHFHVSNELSRDVTELTLSYSFFHVDDQKEKTAEKSARAQERDRVGG